MRSHSTVSTCTQHTALLLAYYCFTTALLLLTSRRPHKLRHNLCCHAANARAQVEENHLLCHGISVATNAAAVWPFVRREHGLGKLPHPKRCHLPIRELNTFLGSTPPRYLPRPERSQDLVCELPVICTDSWREGGLSERERERESERAREREREIEREREMWRNVRTSAPTFAQNQGAYCKLHFLNETPTNEHEGLATARLAQARREDVMQTSNKEEKDRVK